ncbi:hypothetical protein [Hydrogenophaga sp.]
MPDPPYAAPRYRALLGVPIQQQPQFNPRIFAVLALITIGHRTSDALIESLQDQLHRTTIFALLVEATDAGLLKFKAVVTKAGTKREFSLTKKGEACLNAYNVLQQEYVKPSTSRKTNKSA